MTNRKHVIVVGAGHNGLVCAALLAHKGIRVTVLESARQVGGAAVTHRFADGYRVSSCAHLLHQLDPELLSDLELDRHGLRYAGTGIVTTALSLESEPLKVIGQRLEGGDVSPAECTAYRQFMGQMAVFASLLRKLYVKPPPRLDGTIRSTFSLASDALAVRRLGRSDMRELLRIVGSNIHDVLNERFDCKLLRGLLGLDAVLGTHLGTRSANTMLTFLHRLAAQTAGGPQGHSVVAGGMGTLSDAMLRSALSAGADVRTSARVAEITIDSGECVGVKLESGESINADAVVSNADPKTTFQTLVGYRHLEAEFARRITNLRTRGNAAKLHLALKGLPSFGGLDEASLGGRLVIAPSSEYVDRAFNPAKYGEYSKDPVMEISIPSVLDSDLAPPGHHVLSAVVQYAPYDLAGGWDEHRDRFCELVIDRLALYSPDLRDHLVHAELLTPVDLERRYGMTGGHWHHHELALDSFHMLCPTYGAAQYHTPVNRLFLCGAGAHPGGGVMGTAGRNAAKAVTQVL